MGGLVFGWRVGFGVQVAAVAGGLVSVCSAVEVGAGPGVGVCVGMTVCVASSGACVALELPGRATGMISVVVRMTFWTMGTFLLGNQACGIISFSVPVSLDCETPCRSPESRGPARYQAHLLFRRVVADVGVQEHVVGVVEEIACSTSFQILVDSYFVVAVDGQPGVSGAKAPLLLLSCYDSGDSRRPKEAQGAGCSVSPPGCSGPWACSFSPFSVLRV